MDSLFSKLESAVIKVMEDEGWKLSYSSSDAMWFVKGDESKVLTAAELWFDDHDETDIDPDDEEFT